MISADFLPLPLDRAVEDLRGNFVLKLDEREGRESGLEAIQNVAKDAIHQLVRKYLTRRVVRSAANVYSAIVDQVTS